jgi:hypothetical protein
MFANLQGGFKLKSMRVVGGNDPIGAGEWRDVDATIQDISKAIYPLPYKEPSQTLLALHDKVVAAGQKFADTTEQVIADSTNYGPVGTTLALLEASTKFFSATHKRIHAAQKQEFKILRRLDKDYLSRYPYAVQGAPPEIFRIDIGYHSLLGSQHALQRPPVDARHHPPADGVAEPPDARHARNLQARVLRHGGGQRR